MRQAFIFQFQMSKTAHERVSPKKLSRKNEILKIYWILGRATREEIKKMVSFNLDTNSGRFTEAVDEKLLTDVGKVNGFTVYQLTDEGKERVKQIMRGKR